MMQNIASSAMYVQKNQEVTFKLTNIPGPTPARRLANFGQRLQTSGPCRLIVNRHGVTRRPSVRAAGREIRHIFCSARRFVFYFRLPR